MYEVIITKIFVFDITSDADYDFVAISKLSPNFTTIKNGPILQSLAIMETESETKYCCVFFSQQHAHKYARHVNFGFILIMTPKKDEDPSV